MPAAEGITALERIGHLTPKICALWGTAEFNVFFGKLLLDSRDGTRQGLPAEVATELAFLAETNKILRAINVSEQLGLKFDEAFRRVDTEDQQSLKFDALDDPLVSRDTLVRRNDEIRPHLRVTPRSTSRDIPPAPASSQLSGLFALLMMLMRNKWLWAIIMLALAYRLVRPWLQTLD
jgi:hypothetical protein